MLKPYQELVVNDKEALDEKIEALRLFFNTETFQALVDRDKYLLVQQAGVMANYSRILGDRIARITQE
jgi:hypothetical protein